MLNTLRGAKIVVLTLKRYDDHPCLFYMGVPPQGLVIHSTRENVSFAPKMKRNAND